MSANSNSSAVARRFHIFTAFMCFGEAFFAAELAIVPYLAKVPNRRWWVVAVNATAFSVLGGVVFFALGWGFASVLAGRVVLGYEFGSTLELLNTQLWADWFQKHGWVLKPWSLVAFVTFVAAVLPVPYKIYGLAAGLSGFGFIIFVVVSILGKLLRYGFVFYAACRSIGWLGTWLNSQASGPPKWLGWIKP